MSSISTFLGYYVHQLSPFVFQLNDHIGLRWYGLAYVLAFVCGYLLYHRLAKQGYGPIPSEKVADFIALAAVFGVLIGGRIGWVLFYGWDQIRVHPLDAFKVWQGGMSSHGGILGLVIFTWVYARIHHLCWPAIGDNVVVVAPIGLFFGRIANFINGELWGRIVPTHPAPFWAMQFPKELESRDPMLVQQVYAHNPDAIEAALHILPPRYPSQLIEAALEGVVLFLLLYLVRTRTRTPAGFLTGLFFIAYAILRIIGEQFREPDVGIPLTHGLTRGQFLSLFMILIGGAFMLYSWRTQKYFVPAKQ